MNRKIDQIGTAISRNEERKETLGDLKKRQTEAQNGLTETSNTITKTQNEKDKLQGDIDGKKSAIEKLEGEQSKLQKSASETKQGIEGQQKLLEDPTITPEARKAIEQNIAALTQALKIINDRLAAIPGEIAPLKKEKDEFERQYKDLAATLPDLKTKRDGFEATLKDLKPKIDPLEQKLMAKNTGIIEQLEKAHKLADTREAELDRREEAEKSMSPYERDYTWPA